MATRTTTETATGVQPRGLRVGLVAASAIYSVGATLSLSAGDIIQMVKIPKGAKLVYVAVSGGSGDALVGVGDDTSPSRYMAFATMSSASTVVRTITLHNNNVPYEYSLDDTIDLSISTVSVGTITGGFHMTCIFSMDT